MKRFYLLIIICITYFAVNAQQNNNSYKILFYNVENLFDTLDDTLKNDEEFLPEGDRFWTKNKYYTKLNNIYKVITAIGEWNPPAIIGLCEIENRKVLNDLVNNTPLNKHEYQIIHQESPDRRGIDVGLLYRKELFNPISEEFIPIHFPDNPSNKTRDILYAKGIANNMDTVHVFVNHWPSRWGGQLESEPKRVFVASVLKAKTDSIFISNPNSNILIIGDFNDYPDNISLHKALNASHDFAEIKANQLYNLSAQFSNQNIGTHKYQGKWGVLDQVIVSGNLLNNQNKIYTQVEDIHIFNKEYLLEPDETHFGYKPKRTFIGYKYNGGFSDHLPTYLILNFNK